MKLANIHSPPATYAPIHRQPRQSEQPQGYQRVIHGLTNLDQWTFVGATRFVGRFAGQIGQALLPSRRLSIFNPAILFDEVATGILTGHLRGSHRLLTHIARDIGEGLAVRGALLRFVPFLAQTHLLRFFVQPLLMGVMSYGFQYMGDKICGEKTLDRFDNHLWDMLAVMIQGGLMGRSVDHVADSAVVQLQALPRPQKIALAAAATLQATVGDPNLMLPLAFGVMRDANRDNGFEKRRRAVNTFDQLKALYNSEKEKRLARYSKIGDWRKYLVTTEPRTYAFFDGHTDFGTKGDNFLRESRPLSPPPFSTDGMTANLRARIKKEAPKGDVVAISQRLFSHLAWIMDYKGETSKILDYAADRRSNALPRLFFALRKSLPGNPTCGQMDKLLGFPANKWTSDLERGRLQPTIGNMAQYLDIFTQLGLPLEALNIAYPRLHFSTDRLKKMGTQPNTDWGDRIRLGPGLDSLRRVIRGENIEDYRMAEICRSLPVDPMRFYFSLRPNSDEFFLSMGNPRQPVLKATADIVTSSIALDIPALLFAKRMSTGLNRTRFYQQIEIALDDDSLRILETRGKTKLTNENHLFVFADILAEKMTATEMRQYDDTKDLVGRREFITAEEIATLKNSRAMRLYLANQIKARKIVYMHYHPLLRGLHAEHNIDRPFSVSRHGITVDAYTATQTIGHDLASADLQNQLLKRLRQDDIELETTHTTELAKHLSRYTNGEISPKKAAEAFLGAKDIPTVDKILVLTRYFPQASAKAWFEAFHRSALAYFLGTRPDGQINYGIDPALLYSRDQMKDAIREAQRNLDLTDEQASELTGLSFHNGSLNTTLRKRNISYEKIASLARIGIDRRMLFWYFRRDELQKVLS